MGWIRSTRNELAKIRRQVGGSTGTIKLAGGATYKFSPDDVYSELFSHFMNVLRADHHREPRPEPPELLRAIANAADRERAFHEVLDGYSFVAYQKDPLIERGEFVPSQLTTEGPVEAG
jgi:hypothetical protein